MSDLRAGRLEGDHEVSHVNARRARRNLVVAVSVASFVGASTLSFFGWLSSQPGILFEVLFYPVLAACLASISVVRRDFLQLPELHRRLFLGLVFITVVAQFLGGGGDLFPGARWAMFSDNVPDVTERRIVIELDDGQVEGLDAADLFGALRNGRAESLLGRLDASQARQLLLAYASRFEDLHPDLEVQSVRVVEIRLDDAAELGGPAALTTVVEATP